MAAGEKMKLRGRGKNEKEWKKEKGEKRLLKKTLKQLKNASIKGLKLKNHEQKKIFLKLGL